jgi:processive 1,2-diacylglycerol beta-glucosyltransferase
MSERPPRILILSASIGEGHDLPARVLAEGIRAAEPSAEVEIQDFLALIRPTARRIIMGGSQFHSKWGARVFDLEFRLLTEVRPAIWLGSRLMAALGGRATEAAIAQYRPDVIVSTYLGATELLGRLRARGRIGVPVVSAITDLAALRYWAHPAVDMHLITHPESAEEVRSISPTSVIECVRGLTDRRFYERRDPADARRALAGATEVAIASDGVTAVCLCGRNESVREALSRRFAGDERIVVLGFSDQMAELMAAADVLVHSTAGLTVLEALMQGCRVISYGWGHGHVRVNNEAYRRFGLARVATNREELRRALRDALDEPRSPDRSFESLPEAASFVLEAAGVGGSNRGHLGLRLRDHARDHGRAREEPDAGDHAHERGHENGAPEGR